MNLAQKRIVGFAAGLCVGMALYPPLETKVIKEVHLRGTVGASPNVLPATFTTSLESETRFRGGYGWVFQLPHMKLVDDKFIHVSDINYPLLWTQWAVVAAFATTVYAGAITFRIVPEEPHEADLHPSSGPPQISPV